MNISYEGIGHVSVTFPANGCQAGKVCKMGSDGKMTVCAAGDAFCGLAESVNGSQAGVQIHGFAEIGYTGTAPATGYVNLSANGSGGIKTDSAGKSYLVVKVDTAAQTAVIEL